MPKKTYATRRIGLLRIARDYFLKMVNTVMVAVTPATKPETIAVSSELSSCFWGGMRKEYDFSNAVKNPYVKPAKTAVTIRLDQETVDYFKTLAAETTLPYQTLINSYLSECAKNKRKLTLKWS